MTSKAGTVRGRRLAAARRSRRSTSCTRGTLELRDRDGDPVEGASIGVDGDMPEHGHGLPTEPRVRELGDGRYEVDGMKFQMGGIWYVEFAIAAAPGRDVARVEFIAARAVRRLAAARRSLALAAGGARAGSRLARPTSRGARERAAASCARSSLAVARGRR